LLYEDYKMSDCDHCGLDVWECRCYIYREIDSLKKEVEFLKHRLELHSVIIHELKEFNLNILSILKTMKVT
jgi:hypothetical protein